MPRLWYIFSEHLAYSLRYGPEPTTNDPLADRYGLNLSIAVSEKGYIGWPNATKGSVSPVWGELQSDYYCGRHPDPADLPKHLFATVFKTKLIQAMWIMLQVIWEQRNYILHNEVKGVNVKIMDARLKRIYTYNKYYVFPTDQ